MSQVAVIIPTLNEERHIARCLDSVINQTYPFEMMDIMVVDGRSVDKTRMIVETYRSQYGNIRLLDNPHKIQSVAFNIGVKESAAPFVIRLDAHALYDSRYIELCIAGLQEDTRRGNVGGCFEVVPQNNSIMAEANAILNSSRFGIGGASFRVGGAAGNVDTVPFGAFRRTVIDEVGGMREDLRRGEDNEFNSRIKKAGYDIYFNPEIKLTYFSRPTFKALAKQMFANGESIGILSYIDSGAIGIRHIVPLCFALGVVFGLLLSVVYKPFVYIYAGGLGIYFICDMCASLCAAQKHGWKYFFALFYMFFIVHMSYGFGIIKGLIKKRYSF